MAKRAKARGTMSPADRADSVLRQHQKKPMHPDDLYSKLTAEGLSPEEASETVNLMMGDE